MCMKRGHIKREGILGAVRIILAGFHQKNISPITVAPEVVIY